ncbi:MAG: DUF1007 family protein [Spirochaetaceae bacterium]|nr:DUF1007 family protein [Spirochaetaceae bacterium]
MIIKRFLIILFLLILPIAAFAHPHLVIHSSCEFQFDGLVLDGVWIEFRFDRYFSGDIFSGYDLDQNKIFDKSETIEVYENAFINLKNYGFFIRIRNESERTSPKEVENFSLYAKGDNIIYRFYVDLDNREDRELYISICDPTFFCAISYEEEKPVHFKDAASVNPDYEIIENSDFPVHYDPLAPAGETGSYNEWRPGLQTFYPEEIHLAF